MLSKPYIENNRLGHDSRGPIKAQHITNQNHYSQSNPYAFLKHTQPSGNGADATTLRSLEKSKKKVFSIIEQLTKAKQQIQFCRGQILETQKIAVMKSIDLLTQDLNNEIVNISEDISKARVG